jgi:hypothetical protein
MIEELKAAWAVARKELQVARRYPLNLVNEVLQPLYQFLLPSLLLGLTFYVGGRAVGWRPPPGPMTWRATCSWARWSGAWSARPSGTWRSA